MLLGEYHYEGGRKFVEHRYTVKNVIFFSPYFWAEGKHTLLPAFAFVFVFVFVILVFFVVVVCFFQLRRAQNTFLHCILAFLLTIVLQKPVLGGACKDANA